MGTERPRVGSRLWRFVALLSWVGAVGALPSSCGPTGGTDSSSNWLEACETDAECPATGECVCGICTVPCDTARDCEPLGVGLSCGEPSECDGQRLAANYCHAVDDAANDDGGSPDDSDDDESSSADGDGGGDSEGGGGSDDGSSAGGNGGAETGGNSGGGGSSSDASGGAPNGDGGVSSGGTASGGAGSGGTGSGGASNAGGGGSGVPSEAVTGLCSSGDWCWLNPQPQGHWLYDLVSVGDELWAAADHGTVLRLVDDEWERFELSPDSGTQIQSFAIWGASPDDVWVAAVWTGGTGGTLYRYQNGAWQSFPSPTAESLFGMWGSSADDIWAVGWAGTIIHFDGNDWTLAAVPDDVDERLDSVYGFAPDDVWAVGSQERVLHYDGQSWTTARPSTSSTMHLRSVWGSAPDDIWAVGGDSGNQFSLALHYDGVQWRETRSPSLLGLQTVIGSTDGEVWAIGNQSQASASTLFRAENGELVEYLSGVPGEYVSAAIAPSGDTWFGGETGTMLRYSGGSWGSVGSTLAYDAMLSSAWMSGDASIGFIVGYRIPQDGIVLRWNGSSWAQGPYARTSAQQLFSVHGTAADDVWMVGRNQLFHFDGDDWTQLDSPVVDGLGKVFARARDDVWFAGDPVDDSAVIVSHFDGDGWTRAVDGPMTSLGRLWSPAEGALWVLANQPFFFDGANWTEFSTTATFGDALDMWGSAPDDAWLVGRAGAIHHFDGTTFTGVASPVTTDLLRVYGRAADDVYAVGALGTILHYDGNVWSVEASGTTLDFNDVIFTETSVEVVAWGTTILRKALP